MFLEWVFDTTVGILTERITLKTLKSIWYSFRAAYERSTYTPIPLDTGKDVLSVSNELPIFSTFIIIN